MKIPENILKKWADLKSRGDIDDILEKYPTLSRSKVSRAINGGPCSNDTFNAIAEFYNLREHSIRVAANIQPDAA